MPAKESNPSKDSSRLWVEKYRPRAVSDVAHQTQVVSTLQKAVKESSGQGDLPHLLFYGPPGTGKTSTALALCRDLFGPANMRARVLELNASDERGIKVVRDKIKNFAQAAVSTASSTPVTSTTTGVTYPCPPFKIIVLDEADAITTDAQTALRRTMETHSKVTRFIIICNYISRIIDPLTSRCAKFRFNPLPMSSMLSSLRTIASAENVNTDDTTLTNLINASAGDLRKAINTLQSAHRMLTPGSQLSMADVAAAACLVPESVIDDFDLAVCKQNASNAAVRAAVDEIVRQGYSSLQLLTQYSERLLGGGKADGVSRLNDFQISAVSLVVADAEKAIMDGCDELIQLYNVASRISRIASIENDLESITNA